MEEIAVQKFQEFLRIKTVQPNPDYASCHGFFESYATELGLSFESFEMMPGKPIFLLKWMGSDPSLKALLLNCHADVVPVDPSHWSVDPFSATKLPNGNIVARGAQDMKSVGIGYLEAIRALKVHQKIPHLKRSVFVSFVPDEEIGGHTGMELWVESDHFKSLNVGLVLDEGLPNPGNAYTVFYGERAPWWMEITTTGHAGHGSQFIEPNATLRLMEILSHFIAFRRAEKDRLVTERQPSGSPLTLGHVTSVNINQLEAGVQANVVPNQAKAVVDMRVAPTMDHDVLESRIRSWLSFTPEEIAAGTRLVFLQQFKGSRMTLLTKENPWWVRMEEVARKRGISLEPDIFPAATDSRYVRRAGYDALGISPFCNTPILLHDHDEFLNERVFLEGIAFYTDLMTAYGESF